MVVNTMTLADMNYREIDLPDCCILCRWHNMPDLIKQGKKFIDNKYKEYFCFRWILDYPMETGTTGMYVSSYEEKIKPNGYCDKFERKTQ